MAYDRYDTRGGARAMSVRDGESTRFRDRAAACRAIAASSSAPATRSRPGSATTTERRRDADRIEPNERPASIASAVSASGIAALRRRSTTASRAASVTSARPRAATRSYRPMTGDDGRGKRLLRRRAVRDEQRRSAGRGHDPRLRFVAAAALDDLDRDYDDYRRENQARFEDDSKLARAAAAEARPARPDPRAHGSRRQRRPACRHYRPRRRRPDHPDQVRSRQRGRCTTR